MITYNLANILTLSRLVLAIIFFVLIAFKSPVAVPVLLLAGLTDVLDGWVARKLNQKTDFGRIADPAMDKVLICCGFVLLVGDLSKFGEGPGIVHGWMVAIIVGRELVVQAIRSLAESRGVEFAATVWGKSKMAAQFVTMTAIISLVVFDYSGDPAWVRTAVEVALYVTVFITAMSGIVYLVQANKLVGKGRRA